MFAILRTGGKQYRVAPGDKIVVERLDGNAGDKITLGDILLAGEGSDLKSVDGLKVQAEIIAQAKGDKVTVFKKRRRHNYRRKKGHRQLHTILQITQIGDQKMEKKAAAPKAEKAEKAAPAPKAEAPQTEAVTAEAPAPAPAKEAKKPVPSKAEGPAAKKSETKPEAKADKKASTENAAPAKAAAKKPAAKAPAKKK